MNLLEMSGITKVFPGVKALDQISFQVRVGEVHAICGENGAGKSTLMKILSGLYPYGSYSGQIFLQGQEAKFGHIRDSQQNGVAIVYQELSLFKEMSVAENIFIGREPRKFGIVDWDKIFSTTDQLFKELGFQKIDPRSIVRDLGIGEQQLVEIAKALTLDAKLLIFDEPTSALAESEVKIFLDLLQRLKTKNISSVLITHKLNEVFSVADRITVFRDGKSIATHEASAVDEKKIISEMVGREVKELFPSRHCDIKAPVLEVENLTVVDDFDHQKEILKNISFTLHAGEVLGFSGLMGAGRSELLLHLFAGFGRRVSGTVKFQGKAVHFKDPSEAINHGFAMVTEDRKRFGLLLEDSVMRNISLASLQDLSKHQFIDGNQEVAAANRYVKDFRIKTPSTETNVQNLSGGNQQKVVLAKWMLTQPKILFLDEPTRGIDVGARAEIYSIVNTLAAEGVGVVMASSELPEVMGMSDRVHVLCEGRITGEFQKKNMTQEQVMERATAFITKKSNPVESSAHL